MFGMNYKEIYENIKEQMKDPYVSVAMKQALLNFEIGVRQVELQEMKEPINRSIQPDTDP